MKGVLLFAGAMSYLYMGMCAYILNSASRKRIVFHPQPFPVVEHDIITNRPTRPSPLYSFGRVNGPWQANYVYISLSHWVINLNN